MRKTLGLAVALIAIPVRAPSQRLGTTEASVVARGTLFDPSVRPDPAAGIGGRVGVFLTPKWLLEADYTTTSAGGLDYRPFYLRVNVFAGSERTAFIAGLGYVRDSYSGALEGHDAGVTSLLGVRFSVREQMFWRLDATLDYIPSPANDAADNWTAAAHIGIGYRFGVSQ